MKKAVKNTENVTKNEHEVCVTHGYARCSTNDSKQDIERQIRDLRASGVNKIWMEYEHGDAVIKNEQQAMFDAANSGDTIVVSEVSRLARSLRQLCAIIDTVRTKKLRLIIIGSITMDCRTGSPDPMTEAFLQIAGVFSQLELQMIRQRVKSGMQNAKAKGKRIGRPNLRQEDIPDAFFRYFALYKSGKINITELARLTGVSRPTVYRYLSVIDR